MKSPIYSSPVVCNTGPLIGLARIGMAGLPFQLFPQVVVPEEVRQELLVADSPDRQAIQEAMAGATIYPLQTPPDPLLASQLGAGEAAVIATAISLGISTVILDERKARRIASRIFELGCKGTAGMLVEAKRQGLINAVRPCLHGMIEGGYFLGPNIVAACLAAADES